MNFPIGPLLESGGLYLLVILLLGIALTVWGIRNFFSESRFTTSQLACSLLPACLALAGVCFSYHRFCEISMTFEPPSKNELLDIIFSSMAYGMAGTISTIIPAGVGIIGLFKSGRTGCGSGLTDFATKKARGG